MRNTASTAHLLVGDGRQHQGRQLLREEGILIGAGVAPDAAVHLWCSGKGGQGMGLRVRPCRRACKQDGAWADVQTLRSFHQSHA